MQNLIIDSKQNFNMSPLARTIMLKRYANKNRDGIFLETKPEEILFRVASDLAKPDVIHMLQSMNKLHYNQTPFDASLFLTRKEKISNPDEFIKKWCSDIPVVKKKYIETTQQFYEVMFNKRFLPAGRTMANAGGAGKIVSNCVVLDINDSLTAGEDCIMSTLHDAAALQNQGSGIGFCFSSLRPHGSSTKNTQASGPVSFIKMYNQVFVAVKQSNRNGANMAVFSVTHPEILEFIKCKEKEGSINAFNVSVSLTDEFMKQATNKSHPNYNDPWLCTWENEKQLPYYIDETTGDHTYPRFTASQILNKLCECAWKNGEPGMIFIDEVNRENPLPGLGKIKACNPCGL